MFSENNSIIFWNTLIPNAWFVGNYFFRHVLDVESEFLIVAIFLCVIVCNQGLLIVNVVDCFAERIEILVFLFCKTVLPSLLIFLVVRHHVRKLISQVLFSKFHRSLYKNLLHAAVFGHSVNVRCWHIYSLVRVQLTLWIWYVVFVLPFFVNINHPFWFWLEQACCPFESITTDCKLTRSSEANF